MSDSNWLCDFTGRAAARLELAGRKAYADSNSIYWLSMSFKTVNLLDLHLFLVWCAKLCAKVQSSLLL